MGMLKVPLYMGQRAYPSVVFWGGSDGTLEKIVLEGEERPPL
jgi:hypothetical protein